MAMTLVQQPLHSNKRDALDPERMRKREELRLRAVRDATKATDAIRAKLRRDLRATRVASDEESRAKND